MIKIFKIRPSQEFRGFRKLLEIQKFPVIIQIIIRQRKIQKTEIFTRKIITEEAQKNSEAIVKIGHYQMITKEQILKFSAMLSSAKKFSSQNRCAPKADGDEIGPAELDCTEIGRSRNWTVPKLDGQSKVTVHFHHDPLLESFLIKI